VIIEGEFRRHGGAVVASAVGIMTSCITLVSYSLGVFVLPLEGQFGWSRQQILSASSAVTFGALATSFFVGWVSDRRSLGSFIILSQIAFGLAFCALALLVHGLATFYAIYFSMAILAGGTLPITFTKLIAARFVRHRGLALGLTLSGTGLAGAIVPPYAGYFVHEFGWRVGYVAVGALPALVAMPLALRFLRAAALPVNATGPEAAPAAGLDFRQALRSWRFWWLAGALFLASGASTGMATNLVPLLIDRGFVAPLAARMAAAFGIAVIAGRILLGILVDRFWAPLLAFLFVAPAALATWYIASAPVGLGSALVLVALIGLATGAEGDLLAYLVTRYFGLRAYGRIFSAMFVGFIAAIGLAAPLYGRSYDLHHSYRPSMELAAAAWILCGVMLLLLGPYPSQVAGIPARDPELGG
jgi:MFS family permease